MAEESWILQYDSKRAAGYGMEISMLDPPKGRSYVKIEMKKLLICFVDW
jgi:hypothetical protein